MSVAEGATNAADVLLIRSIGVPGAVVAVAVPVLAGVAVMLGVMVMVANAVALAVGAAVAVSEAVAVGDAVGVLLGDAVIVAV